MKKTKRSKQETTQEVVAYMRRQSKVDARYLNIKYDDYRFRWRNWLKERDKRQAGYMSALLSDSPNLDNLYVCEAIYSYKKSGFMQ
ncbi:hypothetical protein H6A05_02010 [Megasphaera elsdenii]|uniref:hypothetical protein n=1 Tax=Megasphaera elsdenii TaxID=907 RepID=UPI00195E3762|nr:hypothetical protein [Megasphaera elsdenii]MBM6701101.1 hypothetical protein [Megasphaera elsdenii]